MNGSSLPKESLCIDGLVANGVEVRSMESIGSTGRSSGGDITCFGHCFEVCEGSFHERNVGSAVPIE